MDHNDLTNNDVVVRAIDANHLVQYCFHLDRGFGNPRDGDFFRGTWSQARPLEFAHSRWVVGGGSVDPLNQMTTADVVDKLAGRFDVVQGILAADANKTVVYECGAKLRCPEGERLETQAIGRGAMTAFRKW
jgi:hypothetical protein